MIKAEITVAVLTAFQEEQRINPDKTRGLSKAALVGLTGSCDAVLKQV